MTLDDLKRDAELAASAVELNWDQLSDPTEAEYFTASLGKGEAFISDLEGLYLKLTSGMSVIHPDEPSSLPYPDIEQYTILIQEELRIAYLLRTVRQTYERVTEVTR